jgi:hypothetical protein
MQILRHHRKGPHLNTLERFHIYTEYITNNHINANQTICPNKVFDILLNAHSQKNPPPPTNSSPLSGQTPNHPYTARFSVISQWKDTVQAVPYDNIICSKKVHNKT